jgi:hypothetical protein
MAVRFDTLEGVLMCVPPSCCSATYNVLCGEDLTKVRRLPSTEKLGLFMQNPDQLVSCLGFSIGFPVCGEAGRQA